MVKITITENEENQRLDRFLRKYFKNAPLSHIYKLIRKDVKVNGKRVKIETMLASGDELDLYLSQEQIEEYCKPKKNGNFKKQFVVAYEDKNLIIVEKPFGLLTHGDAFEKKNTLVNQVCGYLQQQGEYDPGRERTFVPSPANRLDRNTTGLVVFGKNSRALQTLNKMIRSKDQVSKRYLTIVSGELTKPLKLMDRMEKDEKLNQVRVLPMEAEGKVMETIARPLCAKNGYSLVEIELVTGRTHQIRAHLRQAGFPVIGDTKYGNVKINQRIRQRFGWSGQLLHAYKLIFNSAETPLEYMAGKEIKADLPPNFERIKREIFD